MSVPASVPKRSGRRLLRHISQSGIRNWASYSSNSTTSPIFPAQIVRLAPERKLLTDLVKMVAYRAESAMLPGVGLLKREAEEGRAFLKTLFQTQPT